MLCLFPIPLSLSLSLSLSPFFSRVLCAELVYSQQHFRSGVYQSISSFAVCDMMIVSFLLLFCLRYYTAEQHKLILAGQAGNLFITQIMLAGKQGDMLNHDVALAGSIGTFFFILIAIFGAL